MSHLEEIIKKRQIKIDNLTKSNENILISGLKKINGVESENITKNNILCVEYNLFKINLINLEKKINELGFQITQSKLKKIKYNLIHFTEENEYSNFMETANSCSNCTTGCSCVNDQKNKAN